ncbi:MAG: hypothetical protein SGPRY_012326, partial [Prymnesium sp.]
NQIIKGTAPLPTMAFAYLIVGSRYRWELVLTVLLLTAGACHHTFPPRGCCVIAVPPKAFRSSVEGIVAAILAVLALSLKQVIYERLLANSSVSGLVPFVIIAWQFALSIPVLLAMWVADVNDERGRVIDFWRTSPQTGVWIVAASSALALSYNLSSILLTKVTSALTLNVIASLKFILTIIIPGVIEQVFAVYNWFGVGIYFVCLCVYSYLEIPLEVEKYEHALKLDEEEGDRFFLSPGGKFIQKTPIL